MEELINEAIRRVKAMETEDLKKILIEERLWLAAHPCDWNDWDHDQEGEEG